MIHMKTTSFAIMLVFSLALLHCFSCGPAPDHVEQPKQIDISDSLQLAVVVDTLRFCTQLYAPSGDSLLTNVKRSNGDLLLTYQKLNGEMEQETLRQRQPDQPPAIAAVLGKTWEKSTLFVQFLDGDLTVQQRVIETAKQWEQVCGIRFRFGEFAAPDITISFLRKGSWSYIGTDSQLMRPSMNLGWLTPSTAQHEFDRVVLHEFGHALGCIHEHQAPSASINWNRPAVYSYYGRPPNSWKPYEVDQNIFFQYDATQTNGTAFDPHSIMIYAIPAFLTLDGYHVDWNTTLSAQDIEFAAALYPQEAIP